MLPYMAQAKRLGRTRSSQPFRLRGLEISAVRRPCGLSCGRSESTGRSLIGRWPEVRSALSHAIMRGAHASFRQKKRSPRAVSRTVPAQRCPCPGGSPWRFETPSSTFPKALSPMPGRCPVGAGSRFIDVTQGAFAHSRAVPQGAGSPFAYAPCGSRPLRASTWMMSASCPFRVSTLSPRRQSTSKPASSRPTSSRAKWRNTAPSVRNTP